MKTSYRRISVLVLFAVSAVALAEGLPPPQLRNDPKRPTDEIAKDLKVTQAQFVACFENVQPAAKGEPPTRDKVHANKKVLLGCLQKANPAITNESLDSVMDRYRPGGHEAQEPR